MVYVQRDEQGRLLRVENKPFDGMNGTLAAMSEEVGNWIRNKGEVRARLDQLKQSDIEMLRIMEDVVNVLVERGVIRFTDLPEAARVKLDQRAVARADLEGLSDHLSDSLPEAGN
jgi:hypothetical protein